MMICVRESARNEGQVCTENGSRRTFSRQAPPYLNILLKARDAVENRLSTRGIIARPVWLPPTPAS